MAPHGLVLAELERARERRVGLRAAPEAPQVVRAHRPVRLVAEHGRGLELVQDREPRLRPAGLGHRRRARDRRADRRREAHELPVLGRAAENPAIVSYVAFYRSDVGMAKVTEEGYGQMH